MEQTDKNVLIDLALNLDLNSLSNLCKTSKKINEIICANDLFWRKKLNKDYPNTIGKIPNSSNKTFKRVYESLVKKESYIYIIFKSECEDDKPPKFWDYIKKQRNFYPFVKHYMSNKYDEIVKDLYPDFEELCGEQTSFEMVGDFPIGTKIFLAYSDDSDLDLADGFLTKEEAIHSIIHILRLVLNDYEDYREELEESHGKTIEEFYGNRTKEELLKYFENLLNEKEQIQFFDMNTDVNNWYSVKEFQLTN